MAEREGILEVEVKHLYKWIVGNLGNQRKVSNEGRDGGRHVFFRLLALKYV